MNKRYFTVYIAFFIFLLSVIVYQLAEVDKTFAYIFPGNNVNLDDPVELQKLARKNPEHYIIIKNIIDQIHDKELTEIEKWLKVDYGVSKANLSGLTWLTTAPPKKRLDFVLERISYHFTITVYRY